MRETSLVNSLILANTSWIVSLIVVLAINVTALVYIPRGRKPTAAMAWLLLIFLLPVAGAIIFLLIGNVQLPAKRRAEQARIDGLIRSGVDGAARPDAGQWPTWFARVAEQNETLTALPPVAGTSAELIEDYTASIQAMAAAIDAAQTYVHVEFYIVSWDKTTEVFFTAMENAVKRGVTVRLLADHIASRKVANADATFAELDRIGVQWAWMLPVQPLKGKYQRPDLRNHRKIVVVDGRTGFVGSQNLIDRTYNAPKNIARGLKWQELVAKVDGPAVAHIDAVFQSDWVIETGEQLTAEFVPASAVPASGDLVCQIVPSGPGYETENNLRLFLSLIHAATEKVIITSPYFVPDEAMVYAITTARQRGLEVQLFVSELGDQTMVYHAQRSYYQALLEAGVRVFLYPAPFILHAKHFSIDDDVAVIGSSNMDIRSFSLNMEVSMLVRGESFVAQMRQVEQAYRDAGRELTLEEWRREPAKSTFLDGVFRLTSALN